MQTSMSWLGHLLPLQPAPLEGAGILWRRHRAELCVVAGLGDRLESAKFARTARYHLRSQWFAVIGEVLERCRCRPFLSHEQQRRCRRQHAERDRRRERLQVDQVMQTLSVCTIADLVVVLKPDDK